MIHFPFPFTRIIHPGAPQWLWALGVLGDFLILGGAFFGLLQLVPNRYRKTLIVIVTFLAGLIYSGEYFLPSDPKTGNNLLTPLTGQIDVLTNVLYAYAIGLGIWSLITFHGKGLLRKRSGWYNNLAFFVAFLAVMIAGFWKDAAPSAISSNVFEVLFQTTIVALGATTFSIVGFFIVSAAYRAFRIRSAEATLMLVAAFIVMLGQVPIGAFLTKSLPTHGMLASLRLENISYWILTQPNMAAQRGITFGIEIGALAMALRTWLSLERGSFFDQEL